MDPRSGLDRTFFVEKLLGVVALRPGGLLLKIASGGPARRNTARRVRDLKQNHNRFLTCVLVSAFLTYALVTVAFWASNWRLGLGVTLVELGISALVLAVFHGSKKKSKA